MGPYVKLLIEISRFPSRTEKDHDLARERRGEDAPTRIGSRRGRADFIIAKISGMGTPKIMQENRDLLESFFLAKIP